MRRLWQWLKKNMRDTPALVDDKKADFLLEDWWEGFESDFRSYVRRGGE